MTLEYKSKLEMISPRLDLRNVRAESLALVLPFDFAQYPGLKNLEPNNHPVL